MTKSITTFDVVLVPFTFADLSASKRRPCLVLAVLQPPSLGIHVVLCMMTSQIDGLRFPHHYRLKAHAAAALPKPTVVRTSKIVTLEAKLITKHLGHLDSADAKGVRASFRALFDKVLGANTRLRVRA